MCSLTGSCCIKGCGQLADYIDKNFETMYLFYIKVQSFIAHHRKSWNNLPPSTTKSIELVIATILALYGGYFSFFFTLFTAYPAIKLLAWTPITQWSQKFKQLISGTDKKLRLDEQIVQWVENQAYSDGIALYLSKSGIVRKFLGLLIAECEGEILRELFQAIFVGIISIYLVFWSTFIRNIMMSLFIYSKVHSMVFQSSIFHENYYEKFQTLFESDYIHWSKLLVELRLFIYIFIYIVIVTWICGTFGGSMSITFGSYLIVTNTVGNKYEPFNFGDAKSEFIHIGAWLFFFVASVVVQRRLF